MINDETIYISTNTKIDKNCYNTSIFAADINLDFLKFEEFFTYPECAVVISDGTNNAPYSDPEEFMDNYAKKLNAHQSGGRMVIIDENTMLFSIGEYRMRAKAQDPNSLFGKILKINLKKNSHSIFAKGLRNTQGLYYDKISNVIIGTDHGPKGGDEINLIKVNKNYGWPVSSYGDHYDGTYKEKKRLFTNHIHNMDMRSQLNILPFNWHF